MSPSHLGKHCVTLPILACCLCLCTICTRYGSRYHQTCMCLLLPPSLAYHLFGSNLDNPTKLGIVLTRAINTADRYFSTKELPPCHPAALQGPPMHMPMAGHHLLLGTHLPLASSQPTIFLHYYSHPWNHTCGTSTCHLGQEHLRQRHSPINPGPWAQTQATKNRMEGYGLLRDSIIIASTAQRVTNKDSKGFKKLPTHTHIMIL
jgi:hypothetical protein